MKKKWHLSQVKPTIEIIDLILQISVCLINLSLALNKTHIKNVV